MFGIELLDIRFKRINYNERVRPKIYDRMISERRQIAERFLSEGNREAARIRGDRVRDLNKIQSEAYRQVEEIRDVADAKATDAQASHWPLLVASLLHKDLNLVSNGRGRLEHLHELRTIPIPRRPQKCHRVLNAG